MGRSALILAACASIQRVIKRRVIAFFLAMPPTCRRGLGGDAMPKGYERRARTRNVSLTYMARVELDRGPSTAIELQSNSSAWPGGPR
jgi:hypothetical protein